MKHESGSGLVYERVADGVRVTVTVPCGDSPPCFGGKHVLLTKVEPAEEWAEIVAATAPEPPPDYDPAG